MTKKNAPLEFTHKSNAKRYAFETKEQGAGWNGDTGFRHRVVCEDGRRSGWASYTLVSFLDDVACVSPYFHDDTELRLVTLSEAMAFIAVGEEKPVEDEPESESDVDMRELAKHPTHIWFAGKRIPRNRNKYELCWLVRKDEDGISFGDMNGNEYCTVSDLAVPNENGSMVLALSDYILVMDDTNNFWGTGPNLESAIKAMPNNMEDLPHHCSIYVCETPMTVTENGCIRGAGKGTPVCVLWKEGRTVKPVMPK